MLVLVRAQTRSKLASSLHILDPGEVPFRFGIYPCRLIASGATFRSSGAHTADSRTCPNADCRTCYRRRENNGTCAVEEVQIKIMFDGTILSYYPQRKIKVKKIIIGNFENSNNNCRKNCREEVERVRYSYENFETCT